ncbi:MAG: GGDEF domain-containing protein [Deltaproteobacteria bacterium]|nr:GGDEF domain-containing protein [Deltaproteobacteria bacterium]
MTQGPPSDDSGDADITHVTMTIELRRRKPERRFTLPTLRVVTGSNMLRFASIYPGDKVSIGREDTCTLSLPDPSVSRLHAEVRRNEAGDIEIEDLRSTNGTAVNGEPVKGVATVRVGDMVEVGGITLRLDELTLEELAHLARVVERLSLANKDALTGLLTRTYIKEELPSLLLRHNIAKKPVTALFLDVDHFKAVNDTWGHQVGDEVLQAVARLLVLSVRDSDVCLRYGGEEFLAILPASDDQAGWITAERLRQQVRAHNWSHYADGLRVTVSLGVATFLQGTESVAEWLSRADAAMYSAKRAGRNRVVVWKQGMGEQ